MTPDDEARILRRRQDAIRADIDRAVDPDQPFGPTILVQIQTTGTAAAQAYPVVKVVPGGTEAEGATPTLAASGPTFFALGVGSAIPAAGSYVLATLTAGRYVFQVDS